MSAAREFKIDIEEIQRACQQKKYSEVVRLIDAALNKDASFRNIDLIKLLLDHIVSLNEVAEYATALSLSKAAKKIIPDKFPDNYYQIAGLYRECGKAHKKLKEYTSALDNFHIANMYCDKMRNNDDHHVKCLLAHVPRNLGETYYIKAQQEGNHFYNIAIEYLDLSEKTYPENQPEKFDLKRLRGHAFCKQGKYQPAIEELKGLEEKFKSPSDTEKLSDLYLARAKAYEETKEWEKAHADLLALEKIPNLDLAKQEEFVRLCLNLITQPAAEQKSKLEMNFRDENWPVIITISKPGVVNNEIKIKLSAADCQSGRLESLLSHVPEIKNNKEMQYIFKRAKNTSEYYYKGLFSYLGERVGSVSRTKRLEDNFKQFKQNFRP